jgi:TnpA family transposase
MIVTDTASYSDIVFGLLTLAGFTYAPQLTDLPDQKLWRIDTKADYGPFNTAARGRIDLDRVRRNWDDIRPSGSAVRRSSAFVGERHAPIDAPFPLKRQRPRRQFP